MKILKRLFNSKEGKKKITNDDKTRVTTINTEDKNTPDCSFSKNQQKLSTKKTTSILGSKLSKTKSKILDSISNLILGKRIIDEDLITGIEEQLICADVGFEATQEIIESIRIKASRNEIQTMKSLTTLLKEELNNIISTCEDPLMIDSAKSPFIILVVGVNGVGKTTTIGKLARKLQQQGKSIILAAGDTFIALWSLVNSN